ncbi:MAG: SPOR domain-containing protein [Gammaproteobacteria bacterium]
MTKYQTTRSTQPTRSYRASVKPTNTGGGFKWAVIGILVGFALAFFIHWKYTAQPAKPVTVPITPKTQSPAAASHPAVQSQAPKFDFYTLLPQMQVDATTPAAQRTTTPPAPAAATITENKAPSAILPTESSVTNSAASAAPPSAPLPAMPSYILNIASIKDPQAADQLKAELTMLGVDVTTERVNLNGQVYFQMTAGPYLARQAALDKQKQLKENGITSTLIKK